MAYLDSKDIKDCEEALQLAWPKIKAEFEKQFKDWEISLECTHRTPERQFELFKLGRWLNPKTKVWEVNDTSKKVTNCDGWEKLSKHNHYPSKAFDVKIRTPEHDITWGLYDERGFVVEHWAALPKLASKHGLVNGGTWTTIVDYPHFEVKEKKK